MRFILTFFCFLYVIAAYSQKDNLSAYVYNATDSSAVEAASIYFDGSTIGTSTNANGYFTLTYTSSISNPLVVSALGYETLYLNPEQLDKQHTYSIYLKESTEELDAVQLETDPWSRKRKLKEFKREFLGRSKFAESCTILNEDILALRYSPSGKTLYASAKEPLLIINHALAYEVRYDLLDFYVNYDSGSSGLLLPTNTYYEGTSYFEMQNTKRKNRRNRNEAYTGSLLHFMRSLSHKKLHESKFQIFHERLEVAPYKFFEIQAEGTRTHVQLTTEELSILYDGEEQSLFQTRSAFYIDEWGNHSPPDAILTGGAMGRNRFAELVPIDFKVEN